MFQYLKLSISMVTSNANNGRDAIFKLTAGGQLPAISDRIGHNPMGENEQQFFHTNSNYVCEVLQT